MWKSLLCFSFSVLAVSAQTPDYFPLQTGNSWIYRQQPNQWFREEPSPRTISVEGKETIRDREYFRTDYFGTTVLLRANADGTVVQYDTVSGTEQPWISLGGPEGDKFPAGLEHCTASGTVISRKAEVTTPAGSFANAVQVRFQGQCADAGTTQQIWAPGVGLVSHEETSFAGPRRWELVAFRPAPAHAAGELAFSVGLDAPFYAVGDYVRVLLTLTNTHEAQIPLRFPSGQSFDLHLFDEAGKNVYTWSATRLFAMVYRMETFGPGTRTYALSVPLDKLPPGRYTARAWLTTDPVQYAGETSFRIVEARANPAVVRR